MLHRHNSRLDCNASRGWRLLLLGTAAGVGMSLAASTAEAQIVRPAIGRYHSDRVDPQNNRNIQGRYLERLAEPRFQERQTHLGWEVRGESYVVIANSSRDDAQTAARAIEAAWDQTLDMADYWSEKHRAPNFSVAAITVHIDQNPRREGEEGDLRFVNDRTHIYLNVAEGEPQADEQLTKLRASTVHAFWRRSEYDRELPTWVRNGLASYVATQQAIAAGDLAPPAPSTNHDVYDPYWQRGRIAQDQLEALHESDEEAALKIRYLLEGDDAQHAPAFFAALELSIGQLDSQERINEGRRYVPNDQIDGDTAVDHLYAALESKLGEWVSNPLVDQPQIVPLEGQAGLTEQQQEMAFILKIAKRQGDFAPRGIQPKIIGAELSSDSTFGSRPLSVDRLFAEAAAPDGALWATLDPQGNLLLSDQSDRLRELFQSESGSYRSLMHNGRWAIETRTGRTTRLIAWMEDNPDSPRQPLVKFEQIEDQALTGYTPPRAE